MQVSEGYPLWALLPPGRQRSPKVKVFLEFLNERLGLAPWRTTTRAISVNQTSTCQLLAHLSVLLIPTGTSVMRGKRKWLAHRQTDAIDPERTFAHPLTGLCLRYGRPSACQRDKTTSNQLDLLCKPAVPGRFGVVSTNEGVFMACTTQVQEIRSLRCLFEEYAFDTARRELCRGPDVIAVTPQVFDLLAYLIRHRERVVTKDDLIGAIWNGRIVSDAALTTRLNAARCAIGDSGEEQRLIKTLPRKGFRFVGQVREAREVAGPNPGDAPESAPAVPDKPSIAVLPFANMSGDPEQEYFADGMVEEITTALSRFKGLFVIARNSSFTFKGKAVDIKEVGRRLGVRYVLEGEVRKASAKVRITGRLIEAATGTHIWADRFERELQAFSRCRTKSRSPLSRYSAKVASSRNRTGVSAATGRPYGV